MKKTINIILLFLLIIIIVFWIINKVVLLSEVKWVVTLNWIAIENAEIESECLWWWNNKKYNEKTTSNKDWSFLLNKTLISAWVSLFLPHEPLIKQTITVKYNEKEYIAWAFDKWDYTNNSELWKEIFLNIELTNETKTHKIDEYKNYYWIAIAK